MSASAARSTHRPKPRCPLTGGALVLLAADGDLLTTSDTGDIATLAEAAGVHVEIVAA
jgi:hypothetical protein